MKRVALILVLASFVFGAGAQQKVKFKKDEFKISEEGFDEAWKALREGNKLYKNGEAYYVDAIQRLLVANKYNDSLPELNYMLGACYLYSNQKREAAKFLEKAYQTSPKLTKDIQFLVAKALHQDYQFEKAIQYYKAYADSLGEKKLKKSGFDLAKAVQECESGMQLVNQTENVIVKNVGNAVNSMYDDYTPVISTDGLSMYFTSKRPSKYNDNRNAKMDNNFYEDIYLSKYVEGEWTTANIEGKALNTKYNNAVLALSHNNSRIYTYDGRKNNGDILVSKQKKTEWKTGKPFSGKINSGAKETAISFTAMADKVYFVSAKEKKNIGGKDIYVSEKNKAGKYGKPKLLSDKINTPYDEESVFISADGKTLYFSSKGHNSMGGYDIFKSIMVDSTWSEPVNLGHPINTPGDDLYFSMLLDGKTGYYVTSREDGYGQMDIYKVIFVDEEGYMSEEPSVGAYAASTSSELALFTGVIADADDMEMEAGIFVNNLGTGKEEAYQTSTEGDFQIELEPNYMYSVNVLAEAYMFASLNLDIKSKSQEINKRIQLQKIEEGAESKLMNVKFQESDAVLIESSSIELSRLVEFLNENSSVNLEIFGFANGGSDSNLAQERAKKVRQYLIDNGINQDRLVAFGSQETDKAYQVSIQVAGM